MNLKNATVEQLDDLHLPDEARVALAEGRAWEFMPEHIEGGLTFAYEDGGHWFMVWRVYGLRLEADGALVEVEHIVDTDGSWQEADAYPYGTQDHAQMSNASRRSWVEYARWVVRHKQDPLREFTRGETKVKSTTWTVDFAPTVTSPVAVRARKGRKKFIPPGEFPKDLNAFLGIESSGGFMRWFDSLDDLKARGMNVTWVSERRAHVRIEDVNHGWTPIADAVRAAREFIYNKQEVK
jgi:hypothetical protein